MVDGIKAIDFFEKWIIFYDNVTIADGEDSAKLFTKTINPRKEDTGMKVLVEKKA